MKKNNQINKKIQYSYKLNLKWIFTTFIIILILSFFYVRYVKRLTYKNIYHTITELSEQTATQLNLAIKIGRASCRERVYPVV